VNAQSVSSTVRVLVVDDNCDAADSMGLLLQLYGYQSRVAYDGRNGLLVAHAWAPDCVISDIRMPDLDGYSLARAIRSDPALSGVKLVALSAFSDEEHLRQAVAAGFDRLLTKPADMTQLVEVLRMIEEIKQIASETQKLAQQNVALAGQTKELIQEVREEVKEAKHEIRELKKEVGELKDHLGENPT